MNKFNLSKDELYHRFKASQQPTPPDLTEQVMSNLGSSPAVSQVYKQAIFGRSVWLFFSLLFVVFLALVSYSLINQSDGAELGIFTYKANYLSRLVTQSTLVIYTSLSLVLASLLLVLDRIMKEKLGFK